MTFLLLNQTFYPDVMATGQYLTEGALRLVERGHQVTVVTSQRAYDQPETRFPKMEMWRGIRIYRVGSTGFGKGAKWKRAADFASFLVLCSLRLALLPRHDVVVALTSPPLISFLGAGLARLRRSRFIYWVMDFNPDEAIAAGWLRPGSLPARLLEWMSRFSLRQATKVIALDRFMRDRIVAKGIPPAKVAVIPPWSHDTEMTFDPEGRERFRKAHGLDGKFVVMYSGNHSPCHPLETLLAAARQLAADPGIVFCFVGGGSEWRKIQQMVAAQNVAQASPPASSARIAAGSSPTSPTQSSTLDVGCSMFDVPPASPSSTQGSGFKVQGSKFDVPPTGSLSAVGEGQGLSRQSVLATADEVASPSIPLAPPPSTLNSQPSTILCLPYQPLDQLAGSLSAADLHVVVMGDPFVGLVHPCKIYNVLSVAAPVLYIGPRPSHLSEMLDELDQEHPCAAVAHGEVDRAVQAIERLRRDSRPTSRLTPARVRSLFSQEVVLPRLVEELESRYPHGVTAKIRGSHPKRIH